MSVLRLSLATVVVAASCAAAGCAVHGSTSVYGRTVTLVPAGQAPKEKGELLAIDQDRIWLYAKDGVREFETATVREVRVERHGEGTTVRRIGLIGGLVSAIALTVSCSSVEGNDGASCAAVGAAVGGVWALTGLLTSHGLDKSAQLRVPAADSSLRAFARFPAGLPKQVRPESLVQGPRPRE
jgi:hypothetical protein